MISVVTSRLFNNKELLVVIVTFNGSKFIKNCIDSIFSSSIIPYIIVIDNCSTDDTVNIIRSNYSNIEIIENSINLGFGKANNIGLKFAIDNGFNNVFLLNQDTLVYPETFSSIFKILNDLDKVGFVSPIHLDSTEKSFEPNFEYFLNKSFKRKLLSKVFFRKENLNYVEIDFVNAAAWFIPVNTLKFIGGFNPIFPHYSEDIDYYNRLKYFGFKNYLVFNSCIIHFSSNSGLSLDCKISRKRELYERVAFLSNINYSFKFLAREQFLKFLYNFVLNIYPFNWDKLKFESWIFFKLVFKSRSILYGREVAKKSHSFLI